MFSLFRNYFFFDFDVLIFCCKRIVKVWGNVYWIINLINLVVIREVFLFNLMVVLI